METIVSGKRIEVTPAIRSYAEEKAGKLPRHYDRVKSVEVLLDKHDSHEFEVELIAHISGADFHVAKSHHDDLYHCIVDAVHKMERQLTDIKEVKRGKH